MDSLVWMDHNLFLLMLYYACLSFRHFQRQYMTMSWIYLLIMWSLALHWCSSISGGKRWVEIVSPLILPPSYSSWEWPSGWHHFHPRTPTVQLFAIPHPDGWTDRGTAQHQRIRGTILHACHHGCVIAVQDATAGTWTLDHIISQHQGQLRMSWALQSLQICRHVIVNLF